MFIKFIYKKIIKIPASLVITKVVRVQAWAKLVIYFLKLYLYIQKKAGIPLWTVDCEMPVCKL
jgi:hypothetical protein